jgi:hypothetical protein
VIIYEVDRSGNAPTRCIAQLDYLQHHLHLQIAAYVYAILPVFRHG